MKLRIRSEQLPLLTTLAICTLMYVLAAVHYDKFFTASQTVNFFRDNVYIGMIAVGMTFVIISGGIDLSVGAVIGFTSILYAKLVVQWGCSETGALLLLLLITSVGGGIMGALIHYFKVPAFLITLAGMFMYRGLALIISTSPVPATLHMKQFAWMARQGAAGSPQILIGMDLYILAALLLLGILLQRWSTWGRSIYAIGGSEQSALLMGLPVGRDKVIAYAFSGLCAGLAGFAFVLNGAGNANHGSGFELDAITVVVIGGTLLTGGVGSIWGTILGLLMYAIINEVVGNRDLPFQNLSIMRGIKEHPSAWLRILIGALILAFILLQKGLQYRRRAAD